MGKLCIGRMVLGMVETNCYFVYDEDSNDAILVDPAKNGIYDKLAEAGINVKAVILTHGHFDHIMGVHELQKKGVKVYALDVEKALLEDANLNASAQIRAPYTVDADEFLTDGQEMELCGLKFKVIATPGHTAGSCSYYFEKDKVIITGDTLFYCSIGRSDLPTGDEATILKSVKMLVDTLPEDVKVYPGHGDATTIGFEKSHNPFCR